MASNVYISLGRLIDPKEIDKKLEKICSKCVVDSFQKDHLVMGTIFKPIVYVCNRIKYRSYTKLANQNLLENPHALVGKFS